MDYRQTQWQLAIFIPLWQEFPRDSIRNRVVKRMRAYFALNIFSVIFLRMTELFASPPSKENSMVVMPFASLTHKSVILFVSLSVTALPSLPSKLALKHTSLNSI